MQALMEAIRRVRNDPFVTRLGNVMAPAFEQASQVQQKAVQIASESKYFPLLAMAGVGVFFVTYIAAGQEATVRLVRVGSKVLATPVGIVFLYVAVYVAIRYAQIMIVHRNSRLGGVFITYPPPYLPPLYCPEVWPRGGPSGEMLDKAREFGGKIAQKLQPHVESGVDALKSKVDALKGKAPDKLPTTPNAGPPFPVPKPGTPKRR
jgi:hypothetical protein